MLLLQLVPSVRSLQVSLYKMLTRTVNSMHLLTLGSAPLHPGLPYLSPLCGWIPSRISLRSKRVTMYRSLLSSHMLIFSSSPFLFLRFLKDSRTGLPLQSPFHCFSVSFKKTLHFQLSTLHLPFSPSPRLQVVFRFSSNTPP
jgi:hypothetical protein